MTVDRTFQKLFRAKEARRRELARLPFEEKIKILLRLQKMADEIKGAVKAKRPRQWKIRV